MQEMFCIVLLLGQSEEMLHSMGFTDMHGASRGGVAHPEVIRSKGHACMGLCMHGLQWHPWRLRCSPGGLHSQGADRDVNQIDVAAGVCCSSGESGHIEAGPDSDLCDW